MQRPQNISAERVPADCHSVTILRPETGAGAELETAMEEDYRLLRGFDAFLGGRLVRCHGGDAYLHITQWSSPAALSEAMQDPEVRRIFARLPLASAPEPYRGEVVIEATATGPARAGGQT
jgi:hypothetical protein